MKKLLVSILTSLFVASFANAASIGVTYEFASVDGSGTEYVVQDGATPNSNTGTSSKDVDIGSIFIETSTSDWGLRIGAAYVPGGAEFVNKSSTQTNVNSITEGTESKTQTIKGEFENHTTLYAEKDLFSLLYVKAGLTHVDIKSLESIGTGSAYDDDKVFGYVLGLGLRHQFDNGIFFKAEASKNEYDQIKVVATNTGNYAVGDIDSTSGSFSIGKNF